MSNTKTDGRIEEVQSFSHRRKEPRVILSSLHKVSFKDEASNELVRKIFNISASGIGVEVFASDKLVNDDLIKGEISFGEKSFPLVLHVAHVTEQAAGCTIIEPSELYRDAVGEYLNVELAALSLKLEEANEDKSVGHKIYNFTGDNNCELKIVESPDELVRYKVIVFGNSFSGGLNQDPSAGQVISPTDFDDFSHGGQQTITRIVSAVDPEIALLAGKFVQNIEYLDQEFKKVILKDILAFPQN